MKQEIHSNWYGAAYYPEHWPKERWATDARMMREAGLNVVRLGEFAWCRMEPAEDKFTFDWLEENIDILAREGVSVLLGTPTAGPPAWLVNATSPDLDCRMHYEDGTRWEFGGRSLCCVNNPRFIERSRLIAQELGGRFAKHPSVMGFQIDNELGMYGTRCYCHHCAVKFREWLRNKYGTINILNERLGMIFGSGEFRDFDDVPLPRSRQDLHNPGLLLDSQRFYSDSNVAFVRMQAEALRQSGVHQPITTNVCHMFSGGGSTGVDGRELFSDLDVAGWDCYPQQFAADPAPATMGLLHDIARAYKGKNYWMLEQQSGAPMGMAADDVRRIRLWAWQSIAHGAEMLLYFRWRTCRFGGEQYWRGILDHDGRPNARYRMIARIGEELNHVKTHLAGTQSPRRAAILLDFDNCESMTLSAAYGAPRVSYRTHAEQYYEALRRRGVPADVVFSVPDPGRHELLVVPLLRLADNQDTDLLRAFVAEGGTLIAAVGTAALNRDHVAVADPVPWFLTDVFGIERIEWSALGKITVPPKERLGEDSAAWRKLGNADTIPVIGGDKTLSGTFSASVWCDHLQVTSAEVLARFADGTPPGSSPAITVNRFGKGQAVYVAAVMEQELLNRLVAVLIEPDTGWPVSDSARVEIVPHQNTDNRVCFILNHGADEVSVRVPQKAVDLLSGHSVSKTMKLAPYDVAILSWKKQ
ncbi:MAG: beta-galactosidase [Victivallales bacterium]